MAGTIVADTLQDGAGNSTAMDNAIYGSAKAWVNYAGASGSINASYNVSSVTRSATGTYQVNFTSALADANYVVAGFARNSGGTTGQYVGQTSANTTYTTTALGIRVGDTGGPNDVTSVSVTVFR